MRDDQIKALSDLFKNPFIRQFEAYITIHGRAPDFVEFKNILEICERNSLDSQLEEAKDARAKADRERLGKL